MAEEIFIPQAVNLTDAAKAKILELKQLEANSNCFLRLYVEAGGCAGFQYGFKMDTQLANNDTLVQEDEVLLAIDELSLPLLAGATVDYEVGLMGSKFVLQDLNASSTCSCGVSFSV